MFTRLLMLGGVLLMTLLTACAAEFYIAPTGRDTNPGTKAAPFATLERARNAVRALPQRDAVTVYLRGGIYERAAGFALEAEDAGTDDAPITYRSYPGETARLIGGKVIRGGWRSVTDPAVRQRLTPAARRHVVQLDLKALGITEIDAATYRGAGHYTKAPIELFFNGQPMQLSRWPREGFLTVTNVPQDAQTEIALQMGTRARGSFNYTAARPAQWQPSDDLMVYGYLAWPFEDWTVTVKRLDAAMRRVDLADYPGIDNGVAIGQRFYFQNILEEVAWPGAYYLEHQTGLLYFWPPTSLTGAEVIVSTVSEPLMTLKNTAHITLQGLTMEGSRGSGVQILGGRDNLVSGCSFRNLGHVAVCIGDYLQFSKGYYTPDPLHAFDGGTNNGVVGCDITRTGQGGIILSAGDRKTLTPGGAYALNNDIRDYNRSVRTYGPGVMVYGCGNRVAHNRIADAPHNAIYLHGNDHVIEYNEIANVALEAGDVGGFYMGYDWTMRGVVLRHNYFHDIGRYFGHGAFAGDHGWSNAIYLDDWTSGQVVEGNLFTRVHCAIAYSGGRDANIQRNLFVDCVHGLVMDGKGLWADPWQGWLYNDMRAKYNLVKPHEPPYSTRYPELTSLDTYYNAPTPRPIQQEHSIITHNVSVNAPWDLTQTRFGQPFVPIERETNTITENIDTTDRALLTLENGRYNLRDNAVPGIAPLPVAQMGLITDSTRSRVREIPVIRWRLTVTKAPTGEMPGTLTITATNYGQHTGAGTATLSTSLPERTRITRPTFSYRLKPGETRTWTRTMRIADGWPRELGVCLTMRQEGMTLSPCWQMIEVPQDRTLMRLPAATTVATLSQAMRDLPAMAFGEGGQGEMRLAICGDHLALLATVHDATIERAANFWEGACLQLYVSPTREAKDIQQFVFLPAANENAAELLHYAGGAQQATPALAYHIQPLNVGYQVAALIPLAMLHVDPAQPFYLEADASSAIGNGTRVNTNLFGSQSPYCNASKYAQMQMK